ncbi:hypothetical protein GCM10027089_62480 [Nocardia thraciensis]
MCAKLSVEKESCTVGVLAYAPAIPTPYPCMRATFGAARVAFLWVARGHPGLSAPEPTNAER